MCSVCLFVITLIVLKCNCLLGLIKQILVYYTAIILDYLVTLKLVPVIRTMKLQIQRLINKVCYDSLDYYAYMMP